MLVLSRQRDETIMIGDDIEISVVDIRGDKVRLGITAPTRIAVHRKEVYEAIKRENAEAAQMSGPDVDAIAGNLRPGSNGAAPVRRVSSVIASGNSLGNGSANAGSGTAHPTTGQRNGAPENGTHTVPVRTSVPGKLAGGKDTA